MKAGIDALSRDLNEIAELLRKYQHPGQAKVVEEILASFKTPNPDFIQLCGIDVWGGAGAVWEVCLSTSRKSEQAKADQQAFRRAFVRLADTMKVMNIGTERSRFIGATFQDWLEKGL